LHCHWACCCSPPFLASRPGQGPEPWRGDRAASGLPPPACLTIESDSQKADNVTGVITAIGNVRILYPRSAPGGPSSRQAQYFTNEGRIVLSGDVDVVAGRRKSAAGLNG